MQDADGKGPSGNAKRICGEPSIDGTTWMSAQDEESKSQEK